MFNLFRNNRKIKLPDRDLNEIKQLSKILFIDDKAFPVVDILKDSFWVNTKRIKDADSLDQIEIKEAHILFVDIQGIGKKLKFRDEGLGLVIALKEKYPNKKIIVYSAEDQGQVQAFHKGIDIADNRLSKLADPYQFQVLVEKYSKEAFSLSECVERIKQVIMNEFGTNKTSDEIINKLNKIYSDKNYSLENVSKIFNLQNAANVASIIQIFLKP
jgi:hypothetical protein